MKYRMIVIDSNIVSELMLHEPNPNVLNWFDGQPMGNLFVTAIAEAEVRTGIAFLPDGARRRGLQMAAERLFGNLFAERILPFDSAAARIFAEFAAERRAIGRPLHLADGQIAAIACSRDMAVATRNVRDFEDIDVEILNPSQSLDIA